MREILFYVLAGSAALAYLTILGYIIWKIFLEKSINKLFNSLVGAPGPTGPQGITGEKGPKGPSGKVISTNRIKNMIHNAIVEDPDVKSFVLELYQCEILKKLINDELERREAMMMVNLRDYVDRVIKGEIKKRA